MKLLKTFGCLLLGMNLVTCCTQKEVARRPVSQSSGEFMKQSVARNIKMNEIEENKIAAMIKKDTAVKYISSSKGYWYYYNTKNTIATPNPIKGDIVFYEYEIKDLKGNVIYSQTELKKRQYVVDKQDIIKGLRDGLKLMQKGEKVTFLFPSHMGYGYLGDKDKIGANEPIICSVAISDIKPFVSETK
jgi:gliding motility-associated peptidyl-prolyl isomerase